MNLRAPALIALCLAAAGCVSGASLRARSEVIHADLERARRSGAMRCAPKELATGEANLEFAAGELDEGNSFRAQEHVRDAEIATQRALQLSKDCGPKQVLVREQPKVVVKIEENDKDGDGVFDKDDQCPDQPGPKENNGCPWPDRDGDGVFDKDDQCPDQPGPKENRGCPLPKGPKDSDGDGLIDEADRCPFEAGPIENLGCPVTDRDKDGIPDKDDACPDQPGPVENKGCPDKDSDGDTVIDRLDGCPDKPGPVENKGCPWPDRDGDGIPDKDDKCPDEPGPKEEQGCPKKYKLVVVTKEAIKIKQQIKFATGSAQIVGQISEQLLDEVAQALKDNAQIKKIRIEGHTDSDGPDDFNMKLSQRRADSVMSALIKRGVDPGRMEAVGFGETRPIASNATKAGKAENRRTEFNIVEQ